MAAFVALALLASLLALVAGGVTTPAAADDVVTETGFDTECIGRAGIFAQGESNKQGFSVTAPDAVEPDEQFTVRIAPADSSFPDTNPSPIGDVEVLGLQNIQYMYALPTNATVDSVEIVPGSAAGINGTPTVTVDDSFSPPRIVLFVPDVQKNPTPPTNETFFTLPTVDLHLTATGELGSNISSRVPGTDEASAGYVFQARSAQLANVRCWPTTPPAPLLFQTAIAPGGSETIPTTTTLTVDPMELPAGNTATLTATVNAPSGAVRFEDGGTVLGFAGVAETGTATLEVALDDIGIRSITATFLGAGGFEPSTSSPVLVSVTDPNDRELVRVDVSTTPFETNSSTSTAAVTVNVAVHPLVASPDAPSGVIRLYRNDVLVASLPAVDAGGFASASHSELVPSGGHLYRAEYLGDTAYFDAAGTGAYLYTFTGATLPEAVTGSIQMNNGAGSIAPDSQLRSEFSTTPELVQTLGGQLNLNRQVGANPPATTTLTVPGGSITGRLATVGSVAGTIEPGSDADAAMEATMAFLASSADLGSGPVDLGSGCIIGPFDVELAGTRAGTNGVVTLTGSGFDVPPVSAGTCRTATGGVLSGAMNARLVGDNTAITLELEPPATGAEVIVEPVQVDQPSGTTSYGQPVQLSVTMHQAEGGNFQGGAMGSMEFYADGVLLGSSNVSGPSGPTKSTTMQTPTHPSNLVTAGAPNVAIPAGVNELTARFIPGTTQKDDLATSKHSEPTTYEVLPAIEKDPVTLELEVVEEAIAGQPADVRITMTPAPDADAGVSPLRGTLALFDLSEPNPSRQEVRTTERSGFARAGIQVLDSDDGIWDLQIALAPGVHDLEARFTPDNDIQWGWLPGVSNTATHEVVGAAREADLSLVYETTAGSGQVPKDQPLVLRLGLSPTAAIAPFTSGGGISFQVDGGPVRSAGAASAQPTSLTIPAEDHGTVGSRTVTMWYEPLFVQTTGFVSLPYPSDVGNLGFHDTDPITFTYEVVDPGNPDPVTTATRVASIAPTGSISGFVGTTNFAPAEEGVAWSQINGGVTYNAPGSVEYFAEPVGGGGATSLGTANVSTSTSTFSGMGLARLSNSAATAALVAGEYEVWGVYTPSNPSFLGSTSERVSMLVVDPDAPLASSTTLSVEPAGVSGEGQVLTLTAEVAPGTAGGGTVTFRSGSDDLGTAPVVNGTATLAVADLEPGEHSLTAEFVPDSNLFEGSTSEAVTHRVNQAPIAGDDDGFTTDQGEALAGTGLLGNDTDADGDPLTASVATQPGNGAVTVSPDGSFTYTPNPDFSGVDTFTYTANDDQGGTSAPATVTVRVRGRTTMTAAPVVLEVKKGLLGLKLYLGTFEGRLTDAGGDPIAGAPVSFRLLGSTRCTAVTDADGVASCKARLLDAVLAILVPQQAVYDGSAEWTPSSDTAPLLR